MGHRLCYAVPDLAEIEASDAVIIVMVSMCHCSASVLFDPGFIIYMCHLILPQILILCVNLLQSLFVFPLR